MLPPLHTRLALALAGRVDADEGVCRDAVCGAEVGPLVAVHPPSTSIIVVKMVLTFIILDSRCVLHLAPGGVRVQNNTLTWGCASAKHISTHHCWRHFEKKRGSVVIQCVSLGTLHVPCRTAPWQPCGTTASASCTARTTAPPRS